MEIRTSNIDYSGVFSGLVVSLYNQPPKELRKVISELKKRIPGALWEVVNEARDVIIRKIDDTRGPNYRPPRGPKLEDTILLYGPRKIGDSINVGLGDITLMDALTPWWRVQNFGSEDYQGDTYEAIRWMKGPTGEIIPVQRTIKFTPVKARKFMEEGGEFLINKGASLLDSKIKDIVRGATGG